MISQSYSICMVSAVVVPSSSRRRRRLVLQSQWVPNMHDILNEAPLSPSSCTLITISQTTHENVDEFRQEISCKW